MEDKNYYKEVFCHPESYPLKSLSELLVWSTLSSDGPDKPGPNGPGQSGTIKKCYQIPSLSKQFRSNSGPKTLVCHDMMGGYLEDRFNDGHTNSDAYRFYYWSLIDIFVYFSHHFITIPPLGWISASHRNGVRCFGTLIIEGWAKYENSMGNNPSEYGDTRSFIFGGELLRQLILDRERIEKIVSALVNLARYFHFDGWLINIETEFEDCGQIGLMKQFLTLLTEQMHRQITDGDVAVIWYDSVTNDTGKLQWQNALNHRNIEFFSCCDGIFLNYCWTEKHLQISREYSLKLNNRQLDVFVGIDVFGRGCFGGGGWNSCEALQMIHRLGLSVALFAPGWTYEMLPENKRTMLFAVDEFKFWHKLSPWLINNEKLIGQFPLKSHFCQGFGDSLYENGLVISNESWFDLKRQQLQPSFWFHPLETTSSAAADIKLPFSHYRQDSYRGGSCLQISLPLIHGLNAIHLFRTKLSIDCQELFRNNIALSYSIVYKFLTIPTKISLKTIFHLKDQSTNPPKPNKIELSSALNSGVFCKDSQFNLKNVSTESKPNSWICDKFTLEIGLNSERFLELSSIEIGFSNDQLINKSELKQTILIGEICLEKIVLN